MINRFVAAFALALLMVPFIASAAHADIWCVIKTHDIQRCYGYHFPPPP